MWQIAKDAVEAVLQSWARGEPSEAGFGEGRHAGMGLSVALSALPGRLAKGSSSDPPSFAGRVKSIISAQQLKNGTTSKPAGGRKMQ
ncbi:hypothetical protein CA85_39710 [Allorhodopirellula solitaria]|uniref:Uncharacterized protein n=1 Tax=Allorhodopirellula solitaria TaxID=2527987 RepID=A0A5C5XAR3_9BACT|nr:hypothetical protein CA85_39710 [Allorhodopirellula solitaria]